jgi:hypothetical protein
VLGWDRRREFTGLAQLHERDGLPKITLVWGGRYVPAVKAFFDSEYGLSATAHSFQTELRETSTMQNQSDQIGRPTSPGLKWRKRRRGPDVAYWFADPEAIKAGYPVKSANLNEYVDRPKSLVDRAKRLQSEMLNHPR